MACAISDLSKDLFLEKDDRNERREAKQGLKVKKEKNNGIMEKGRHGFSANVSSVCSPSMARQRVDTAHDSPQCIHLTAMSFTHQR